MIHINLGVFFHCSFFLLLFLFALAFIFLFFLFRKERRPAGFNNQRALGLEGHLVAGAVDGGDLLDAGGIVLEQKLVYSSGFRVSDRMSERTFKETLVVPAAATGMTFNYYAKARSNRR